MSDTPKGFDVGEMEKKFGKNWTEFSEDEKSRTVEEAISRAQGDIRKAITVPLLVRFFFETGGEKKWGKPDFRQGKD